MTSQLAPVAQYSFFEKREISGYGSVGFGVRLPVVTVAGGVVLGVIPDAVTHERITIAGEEEPPPGPPPPHPPPHDEGIE